MQPLHHISIICQKNENFIFVFDLREYSKVPTRCACTFINFEKKFPPAQPYFGLHVFCFSEKIPPARLFCPAPLMF